MTNYWRRHGDSTEENLQHNLNELNLELDNKIIIQKAKSMIVGQNNKAININKRIEMAQVKKLNH